MRSVRGWATMAAAGVAAAALGGVGALHGGWLADNAPVALPTHAGSTPVTGALPTGSPQAGTPPTIAPRELGANSPTDAAKARTGTGPPLALAPAPASTYATDRPVTDLPLADAAPPTGTDEIGDPDAVIVRMPVRDYGSGYHGDYGRFTRATSPEAELRAAAADPQGCLIVGDSIATTVVDVLVADLRRTLGVTCVYDTWPGRATEGTANALLDIKRRVGLPARVVVMSGTNDIFNPPLFEPQMNRIVDGIGPGHQILWVTTFDSRRPKTSRSAADERNTAWINEVIAERARRTPGMRLIDWDALFRSNPVNIEALLSDGVHPNPAGVEAMVGLVRQSLG